MPENIEQKLAGRDEGRSEPDPNPFMYAITMKPTYKSYILKSKEDPQFIVDQFFKDCKTMGYYVESYVIELDSKKVPHLHGVIRSSFRICTCEGPMRQKGFHIYVKDIYDYVKWENYIMKDQPKEEYSFID